MIFEPHARLCLTALGVVVNFIVLYRFGYALPLPLGLSTKSTHNDVNLHAPICPRPFVHNEFPRKIWQTDWDEREEPYNLAKEWKNLNPDFRHEVFAKLTALTYVQEHFGRTSDVAKTFERLDSVLGAEIICYLALLVDGGVYADPHTKCEQPISTWVPQEYWNDTNVVLGVQQRTRKNGNEAEDSRISVELFQGAIMVKPKHPVIRHVIDRVFERLKPLGKGKEMIAPHIEADVFDTTGPALFTSAVMEALSKDLGRNLTTDDLEALEQPKLIGDVLFVPVAALGCSMEAT